MSSRKRITVFGYEFPKEPVDTETSNLIIGGTRWSVKLGVLGLEFTTEKSMVSAIQACGINLQTSVVGQF